MPVIDPVKRIEALLAQAEPAFQQAFLEMVSSIRSARTLDELATLLSQGRVDEALGLIDQAATKLGSAWSDSYVVSGAALSDDIERAVGNITIDFDRVNFRAVNAMQDNQLRLVQEFSEQQRRATRSALIDGIRRGVNPREQARVFRSSIGLTERQVGAVSNYRRLLENLDRQALSRKLRDGRFDRTVRRAIEDREPLSPKQIDRMVERYRQRAIKSRAETIARTEALRSVHKGSREMFEQAIQGRVLTADQLIREWNTARDERVRGSHAFMHGQQTDMITPFLSGLGNFLMHPGDPSAPTADVIQCRCVVSIRMATIQELQGLVSVSTFR